MQSDERLIIEVSSSGQEDFDTLKKAAKDPVTSVFYVRQKEVRGSNSVTEKDAERDDYSFVFMRDEQQFDVSNAVATLVSRTPRKHLALLVHKTGNRIEDTRKGLESFRGSRIIYPPVTFSHTSGDPVWSRFVKPFFDDFKAGATNYDKLFNGLWSRLTSPLHLMSMILSPVAAVDLILQSGKLEEAEKEIRERIQNDLEQVEQAGIIPELCIILEVPHLIERLIELVRNAKDFRVDHARFVEIADNLREGLDNQE